MSKKIHVMQVTFGMGIGGMERVIMDLCRYIDTDRYRFSICCVSVRGPLADQMEAEGFPVIYCKNQSRLAKYFRGFELGRIFKKLDVQILHTHHTTAFIDATVGARLAGIPILINTDHCKSYPIQKYWMILEKWASFFADEIVAVSHHTREELIRYEGISPDKVSVIHNGINVKMTRKDSLIELGREFGIEKYEHVIGTVGRLEDQKGIDLLLKSVPIVLKRLPKAVFFIVGGGSKEQELKQLTSELKISENVIFAGWRKDAVDLLQLFDCFVSTSNFEGMPMVLLEAMSLSKPIVATSVGGVPEFIQDGFNGILLKSRDADMLGNIIISLLSDKTVARRMGKNGYNLYEKNFTAESMAVSYERLYRKYLGQNRINIL